MKRTLSYNSDIKQLPPTLWTNICQLLNHDGAWERLLEYIKHKKYDRPRFSIDNKNVFSADKDPTHALLDAWSTDYVKISKLVEVLREAEFLREAEMIEECIHQQPNPPREPSGPPRGPSEPPRVPSLPQGPPKSVPSIVPRIRYEVLKRYTNNFNQKHRNDGGNLIGYGGSADVFYGYHEELDRAMAVKRIKTGNQMSSSNPQFMNELKVLSELGTHRNLLQLYGMSDDGPAMCIVYEYMPEGSVQDRLSPGAEALSVRQRLSIAEDTAEGLVYLHSNKLIHRDVKSANILLGENGEAKIADYGITRAGPTNGQLTMTRQFIGTMGYMPIEFLRDGHVSYGMDSYSFGVVLLELLTALPAFDKQRSEICLDPYVKEVGIHKLLDHRAGIWKEDCIKSVIKLSNRLLDKLSNRPLLTDVLPEIKTWKSLQ